MESRMVSFVKPVKPLKRETVALAIFAAGCLRPMKHQIAIQFDARFIALQNYRRSDNVFTAVQAGPC